MAQWRVVAQLNDCPPGQAIEAVAGERVIAIYNVDGEIYALDGVCPHQGGPLGQGSLDGRTVTCPWHGWQFDVIDGTTEITHSICQPKIAVRVTGDDLLVDVDSLPQ